MAQEWIKDKILTGLYKRVSASKEVWALKSRQKGTARVVTVTLGRCDAIGTNEARKIAKEILAKLAAGIHPNEERQQSALNLRKEQAKAAARAMTLREATEQYLKLKPLQPSTTKSIVQSLDRNFSDWLDRPLIEVTRDSVLARFTAIKSSVLARRAERNSRRLAAGLPITKFCNMDGEGEAQRSFRYLGAIINSVMNDDVGGTKFLDSNPVTVLKDKKVRRLLRGRETYLSSAMISAMFDEFCHVEHPEYVGAVTLDDAEFVMLLLLTGMRLDELRLLQWSTVDFKEKTFKALGTKNHSDHLMPMTESIHRIMKRRRLGMPADSLYVFPSSRDPSKPSSQSRTFDRVCDAVGFKFTAHDLRRTFATVASEMGVDITKIGAALNHKKKGVTGTYIQHTANMMRDTLETIEGVIFTPALDETHAAT